MTQDYSRIALRASGEASRDDRVPGRPSLAGVIIRADAAACRWDVRDVITTRAGPAARINRIYLAVRTTKGRDAILPIFLPRKHGKKKPPAPPPIVMPRRRRNEKASTLSTPDMELGSGEPAFRRLGEVASVARKQSSLRAPSSSTPGSPVFAGDVAKTVASLRQSSWAGSPGRFPDDGSERHLHGGDL